MVRRYVLKLRGNEVAAELTRLAMGMAGVVERPDSQFTKRLQALHSGEHSCPSKYLLYRSPVHGLNNQKLDVFNAVAMANAIGRVLVLPYLFGGLLDGGENDVMSFADVWDVEVLKKKLAKDVCFATFKDLAEIKDYSDDIVRVVEHGTLQSLDYYSNLFEGIHEKFVLLDRPEGMLSQFPLDVQNLPEITSQVRSALQFSPRIRERAESVVREMSAGGGEWLCLHLRVEADWAEHCVARGLAHFGSVDFCYGAEEVAAKLWVFLGKNPNIRKVYVAVGDEISDEEIGDILNVVLNGVKIYRTSSFLRKGGGSSQIERAAVDYEICKAANYFVGNSFSR